MGYGHLLTCGECLLPIVRGLQSPERMDVSIVAWSVFNQAIADQLIPCLLRKIVGFLIWLWRQRNAQSPQHVRLVDPVQQSLSFDERCDWQVVYRGSEAKNVFRVACWNRKIGVCSKGRSGTGKATFVTTSLFERLKNLYCTRISFIEMNRSSDLISMSGDLVKTRPPVASSAVLSFARTKVGAIAAAIKNAVQTVRRVIGLRLAILVVDYVRMIARQSVGHP